jgi:hypothetical protein
VIAGRKGYSISSSLKNENLLDKVNVVLISDHGMATVTPQQWRTEGEGLGCSNLPEIPKF